MRYRILIALTFLASAAAAQPPGPPPGPDAPLHGIMNELREQNPEQARELEDLKRSDPQAFRERVRTLINEQAMQRLREAKPDVYEAVSGLNEDDREWLLELIARNRFFEKQQKRWRPGPDTGEQDDREQRRAMRTMLKDYRESGDEAEKDRIRDELREMVSAQYDRHLEMRQRQLDEMKQQFDVILDAITRGGQEKDRIVEERLEALLNGRGPGMGRRGGGDRPPHPGEGMPDGF